MALIALPGHGAFQEEDAQMNGPFVEIYFIGKRRQSDWKGPIYMDHLVSHFKPYEHKVPDIVIAPSLSISADTEWTCSCPVKPCVR